MKHPRAASEASTTNHDDHQPERSGLKNVEGSPFFRFRKFSAFLAITAAILLGFAAGLFAGIKLSDIPVAPILAPPSMSQCTTDTVIALQQSQAPSAEILRQAREHCYSVIHSHGLLKDFSLRELNYVQQFRANGVLMWMVVAVTLSGVLLAGLQLMASYELARTNRKTPGVDSEIWIMRDRVVLKSSITGLFILIMSFAFFLVFVFYVYRFEQVDNQNTHFPAQTPLLPMGGMGPPTTSK